ncbi:uncharacterized protein LOC106179843 [Lingula anatina]|uniref:Uncharacterized protein LOC106179843 n=1 Tax=Lingula anatina TaxID=7574 RepID=A0A1S3K8Y7_LINAN|nr:uncharacterized protein LOC106179843 [Lingula anatina]|eukprot:XP_013419083.1 uncharacterized protein LOC106179843 [Lingula anatina]
MMKDLDAVQIGIQNNTLQENNKGTLGAVQTAIAPVYNCSKLDAIKDIFQELDVLERIEPYLQSTDEKIKAEATLIKCYITDEQQNDLLTTDETVFTFLINGLEKALEAEKRRFRGLSTSELAEALGVLARHENDKVALVQHGAIPLLATMLMSPDEEDVKQSAKTLWKLSLDQENKAKIKEVGNCIDMLQTLSHHSSNEIKNTASRVLLALEQNQGQAEGDLPMQEVRHQLPERPLNPGNGVGNGQFNASHSEATASDTGSGSAGSSAACESATKEENQWDEKKEKNTESTLTVSERAERVTFLRALRAENQRLRAQMTCKFCNIEEVSMVFLPCGHLVSCAQCEPAPRRCPVCGTLIRTTVLAKIP